MIKLVNSESLAVWKDYLTYHAVSNNSDMLSEDIYLANFAFYGTVLNGQQESRPLWKRAISQMSGTQSLGFAIGKVYVDKYFPESSKEKMATLVENLRKALGEPIDSLEQSGYLWLLILCRMATGFSCPKSSSTHCNGAGCSCCWHWKSR
jgi:putative endopeptidase